MPGVIVRQLKGILNCLTKEKINLLQGARVEDTIMFAGVMAKQNSLSPSCGAAHLPH